MPDDNRPDKSWFDRCVSAVSDKADDPAALCGWIWQNKKLAEGEPVIPKDKDECTAIVGEMKEESKSYLECEIFAVGQWNKDKYNSKDLQQMVDNFNELKDVVKPPAKIGHSEHQDLLKKEGLPAAGWVDKLKMVGDKVIATFRDVPKVVKDLIDRKAYKRVSAEIYPKYKNPINGKVYNNVLRAVAFLGSDVPAVETLQDISNLYKDNNQEYSVYSFDLVDEKNMKGGVYDMGNWFKVTIDGAENKENLVKKLSDALGVKVNVEDGAELTDEERKKKEEEDKNKEIKDKRIEELTQSYEAVSKLQGDKDKKIAELEAKIAALEKEKQGLVDGDILAKGKMGDMEKANADMMTKLSEVQKNTKTDAIKSFVKQQIAEGKVLPKDEGIIVALMEQLDDKAVVKFTQDDKETSEPIMEVIKKFISGLPKVVEFKEISPNVEHKVYESKVSIGGVSYEVKDLELVQKAEKYAQDNKCAFDVALLAVSKE